MQPIIDYIKEVCFSRIGLLAGNAKWLYNANGYIAETPIEESDLKNVVELTNKICMDSTYPMHVRIVNYRKYIELTKTNCVDEPSYQVLSKSYSWKNNTDEKRWNYFSRAKYNGCWMW